MSGIGNARPLIITGGEFHPRRKSARRKGKYIPSTYNVRKHGKRKAILQQTNDRITQIIEEAVTPVNVVSPRSLTQDTPREVPQSRSKETPQSVSEKGVTINLFVHPDGKIATGNDPSQGKKGKGNESKATTPRDVPVLKQNVEKIADADDDDDDDDDDDETDEDSDVDTDRTPQVLDSNRDSINTMSERQPIPQSVPNGNETYRATPRNVQPNVMGLSTHLPMNNPVNAMAMGHPEPVQGNNYYVPLRDGLPVEQNYAMMPQMVSTGQFYPGGIQPVNNPGMNMYTQPAMQTNKAGLNNGSQQGAMETGMTRNDLPLGGQTMLTWSTINDREYQPNNVPQVSSKSQSLQISPRFNGPREDLTHLSAKHLLQNAGKLPDGYEDYVDMQVTRPYRTRQVNTALSSGTSTPMLGRQNHPVNRDQQHSSSSSTQYLLRPRKKDKGIGTSTEQNEEEKHQRRNQRSQSVTRSAGTQTLNIQEMATQTDENDKEVIKTVDAKTEEKGVGTVNTQGMATQTDEVKEPTPTKPQTQDQSTITDKETSVAATQFDPSDFKDRNRPDSGIAGSSGRTTSTGISQRLRDNKGLKDIPEERFYKAQNVQRTINGILNEERKGVKENKDTVYRFDDDQFVFYIKTDSGAIVGPLLFTVEDVELGLPGMDMPDGAAPPQQGSYSVSLHKYQVSMHFIVTNSLIMDLK